MSWLPAKLPGTCKIIISTAKSDATFTYLSQRTDVTTITVPLLNSIQSREQVITGQLALHHKSLDSDQLSRIVKSKLSDCPLFLTILANELRVFGVYSRLDSFLDRYLEV